MEHRCHVWMAFNLQAARREMGSSRKREREREREEKRRAAESARRREYCRTVDGQRISLRIFDWTALLWRNVISCVDDRWSSFNLQDARRKM